MNHVLNITVSTGVHFTSLSFLKKNMECLILSLRFHSVLGLVTLFVDHLDPNYVKVDLMDIQQV